jgi:mRNA-degrading endonuclease RelE of RelBE toxin-antitoxin system
LAAHPQRDGQRDGQAKKFDFARLHSARRGDFRVYRIKETDRRIDIVAIEHRSVPIRPR